MKRNLLLYIVFFLTISTTFYAQNDERKWMIGFGSASVLYSQEDGPAVEGRYIAQFPRLIGGLYAFKNITLVGSISVEFNDNQGYKTLDGFIRYDFGTSMNKVSPYVLLGGSTIKSYRSKYFLPTLNFGAGSTFWFSDKFGLNGELMYKFNEERFSSQKSHIFAGLAIVYRFSLFGNSSSLGGGSSKRKIMKDSKRKRIWNTAN